MSKFGVMVMGPAGAGKSTFCGALLTHLQLNRRSAFYVNLDPAAETFEHAPDLDIRDLISLRDAMEEVGLGPNGGLLYCFDFLMENLDFLTEALAPLTDEYLVVFDMPGQIELYTHVPVLPALVRFLTAPGSIDMRLCAAYLLEATFVVDRAKFFAGTLSAMSAMLLLEVPHINVLSKIDLVRDQVRRRDLDRFLVADPDLLADDPADRPRRRQQQQERRRQRQRRRQQQRESGEGGNEGEGEGENENENEGENEVVGGVGGGGDEEGDEEMGEGGERPPHERDEVMRGRSFRRLNRAVAGLIDSFGMVRYLKLEVGDEDSVGAILSYIDDCVQYHEAQDPREPRDDAE